MDSNQYKKNIVIFRETGGGKSSLINLLTQSSMARVSDKAIGSKFKYQSYSHRHFTLYDTAGLSGESQGQSGSIVAIKNLITLLNSLRSGGVSLLIYVIPQGRIKETTENNYNLFVRGICQSQVPVILAVTHCELETYMMSWWKNNESHFSNYDMNFAEVVCGTAAAADPSNITPASLGPHILRRRDETRQRLEESIGRCCQQYPWRMTTLISWFKLSFNQVWKSAFGGNIISILPYLRDILVTEGQLSKEEAIALSNEIAEGSIFL